MSVRPNLYVEDSCLEFVNWLQLRTEEAKARWNRQKNMIEMNLAGSTRWSLSPTKIVYLSGECRSSPDLAGVGRPAI